MSLSIGSAIAGWTFSRSARRPARAESKRWSVSGAGPNHLAEIGALALWNANQSAKRAKPAARWRGVAARAPIGENGRQALAGRIMPAMAVFWVLPNTTTPG